MTTNFAIPLVLTSLVLLVAPNAAAADFVKIGDIKGEVQNFDDINGEATAIKGEATDEDHKDWILESVLMYSDLVWLGFTAEQASQIVEYTFE